MRFASLPLAVLLASTLVAGQDKGPRIAIEPMTFSFGKVLQQKTLHKDFALRNLGSEDLKIGRVSTTCGCTAALADSDVVKPGSSTTLRVDLETRTYLGKVERKILVESNDPDPARARLQVVVSATVSAE